MDPGNPFAALVQDLNAEAKTEKSKKPPISSVLEDIFGFTLIEENARKRNLIFLKELAEVFPQRSLDIEILEHALFERLLLDGDEKVEEVLMYLFDCYCKLEAIEGETLESVKAIIMRDIVTSLKQPDLYTDQNVSQQFFNLANTDFSSKLGFFEDLYTSFVNDEGRTIYYKIICLICKKHRR